MRRLLFTLLYASQLWRMFRWLNRGKVKILMYHGVTDLPVLNWTQIDAKAFARQMHFLTQLYRPVRLEDAVDMLAGRRPLEPHAVVVTFDDGFKNNVTTAYPILQRYGIPATIFVTTSFLDRSPRFGGFIWTDYIYALLDATACQELDLTDSGLGRHDLSSPVKRSAAKDDLCRKLKSLPYQEKNRLIEVIRNRVGGRVRPESYQVFGPMTWQDMRDLASGGLVSYGAHTVNHEILSRVPEAVMTAEIKGSQERLEQELGRPVGCFAYPNGTLDDFSDATAGIIQQTFSCALTTVSGQNKPGDDPYRLRRLSVGRDTHHIDFVLSLSGILDVVYRLRHMFTPEKEEGY